MITEKELEAFKNFKDSKFGKFFQEYIENTIMVNTPIIEDEKLRYTMRDHDFARGVIEVTKSIKNIFEDPESFLEQELKNDTGRNEAD
jgi:hypothetical protein